MEFFEASNAVKRDKAGHYRWCAEHEGARTLLSIRALNASQAYHHARDAAHWAKRMLEEEFTYHLEGQNEPKF